MYCYKIIFLFIQLISFSFCKEEVNLEKNLKLLNGFIDYYNNLPNQVYTIEDGTLDHLEKVDDTSYRIQVILKVTSVNDSEIKKHLKCTTILQDQQDAGVTVLNNEYQCQEQSDETNDDEEAVTVEYKPIQLDNEVQTNTAVTSGEQFIAIPREELAVPCIGCASHVNPQAAGVAELASLGLRHLDRHEPSLKHSLKNVVDVERQVQVVNGVRYILTLLVEYNNCSDTLTELCLYTKPCKISILEKPWVRLPNGGKYRAIVTNNCTEDWQFGDNGEVLNEDMGNNNKETNEIDVNPNDNNAGNQNIKVVHTEEIQSQQNQDKLFTKDQIKNIEEQIVPDKEFAEGHLIVKNQAVITTPDDNKEHFVKEEGKVNKNSVSVTDKKEKNPLNEDKKKAIDDLINFFNLYGFGSDQVYSGIPRVKRSYDRDLEAMHLAEKYEELRNTLTSGKHLYNLAQTMVDYLNEMDLEVKTRVLREVLKAEEEVENYQHFFYIQARVIIPCEKAACSAKDTITKICSGVIDDTDNINPRMINAFCYNEEEEYELNKVNSVPFDDPVLLELAKEGVTKIETESSKQNAIKIKRIIGANTQKVPGTLTKFTVILNNLNCTKYTPLSLRQNCTIVEQLGSNVCEVIVHERHWLKEKKITYTCIERPIEGSFSSQRNRKTKNFDDPKLVQMVQEALQYLEIQSNRNNKQKIIAINSISTELNAGLLTDIEFDVGYTQCSNNIEADLNTCKLLANEPIRKCKAQIWDRTWIEDGRKVDVTCEDVSNTNDGTMKDRKKRSLKFVGGEQTQDVNSVQYKTLAEESLLKFMQLSGTQRHYKIVKIKQATVQIVSGTITKIEFTGSPTDCELSSDGQVSANICNVVDPWDIITCKSSIFEQPWLNNKQIQVACETKDQKLRQVRQVNNLRQVDLTDPKYQQLAKESFLKYIETSGNVQANRVIRVKKVAVQIVSGIITRINFEVSSDQKSSDDIIKCRSVVWEKPWLNKKEIDVDCHIDNQEYRVKRQIPGGLTEADSNDPSYKQLAEESLQKYLQSSGTTEPHKVVSIEKVSTQVVSGKKTLIDFTVSPTIENSGDVIKCHSEVWEQPWLKKKEIDVNCHIDNQEHRVKRQIRGGLKEADPNDPNYKQLAEESLQKYLQSSGSTEPHKVVSIEKVRIQVVSGTKTLIDFTVSPTIENSGDVIKCHSEVWEQPWLNKKEITVNCKLKKQYKREIHHARKSISYKKGKRSMTQDPTKKEFRVLAQESLQEYQRLKKICFSHKVLEVKRVDTRVVTGMIYDIDFIAVQTVCSAKLHNVSRCKKRAGSPLLYCNTNILSQPWIHRKKISVSCNSHRSKRSNNDEEAKNEMEARNKRQAMDDDDYIDEDLRYYYAERAMQQLNHESQTNNLYKLVTIHTIQNSVHMGANMVRIFIEIAPTFCLRHADENDLQNCEEMDGLNHKLCLARMWPSSDDELAVQSVNVICDDDSNFASVTGLSVTQLLKASLKELESSHEQKYKLVHLGEPHLVPNLDPDVPTKLSFIVGFTNCSKEMDLDRNRYQCFMDEIKGTKPCTSFIWFVPNSREIYQISVKCREPGTRRKRSVPLTAENATADDLEIQKLVQQSLEKLEMASIHRYKQRVLLINSYSTKITTGKVTTIDFDVGYTSCLKYEWVDDVTTCEFLEHLPRRHCVSQIYERLWLQNGKNIEVNCEDDETPLEAHIEFESAEMAMQLAKESLKHIEAKYPHPRKQKVVRIFSLDKQVVAGIHYRMKIEVGFTNCPALSIQTDCKVVKDEGINRFCRVNVWLRPWTEHPPNYRVTCDYQESATAEVYHHIQAEHLFYDFLTTYRPDYLVDHNEMRRRFDIFKNNVKLIHELNIHERGTARYGVTRFADLTYEEFSTKYMGLKPSLRNNNQTPMRQAEIPKSNIPEKFDWREFNTVTEVKDQGSCGSCWAFSVTGNIEGQWKMHTGDLVSLSEQELVDCDKLDQGCDGGLPDNAYRAIEQLGGLEKESDYPYEGADDKCVFNKTLSKVQISGAVNISSNETDMAQWLVHNGPISIGINANAMQFYMGGISHPWRMLCNPSNLDHGVLIVGYGIKDYPLFHKRLPYWTIKNSWGKSWGEQGYYRIYRGDGTCGVNQMASSAVI